MDGVISLEVMKRKIKLTSNCFLYEIIWHVSESYLVWWNWVDLWLPLSGIVRVINITITHIDLFFELRSLLTRTSNKRGGKPESTNLYLPTSKLSHDLRILRSLSISDSNDSVPPKHCNLCNLLW